MFVKLFFESCDVSRLGDFGTWVLSDEEKGIFKVKRALNEDVSIAYDIELTEFLADYKIDFEKVGRGKTVIFNEKGEINEKRSDSC